MSSPRFHDLKDVEVFQAGTYYFEDENGKEYPITYSDDDVKQIAENTNKLISDDTHSPPGKLGHDGAQAFAAASGLPAVGWVSRLQVKGADPAKLVADFTDVPSLAFKALKGKLYKKISSEIYHAKATARNFGDKVKGLTLRAVAFLGADVPRVKGLAAFLSEAELASASGEDDVRAIVYGEERQREVSMAEKKGDGPLMVPANRHPYGALVTGVDGAEGSKVEAGKKYKVHSVHSDGSYDVAPDDESQEGYPPKGMVKRVPHDHLALMAEGGKKPGKEAKMAEMKALEAAEAKANEAILLAEKNGKDATAAKAELKSLQKQMRDGLFKEFCEKHSSTITPALQPKLRALMEAGVEVGAVKFGEGDEKPYAEQFMAFLSELVKAKGIALGEAAPSGKEGGAMAADPAEVALAEEPFQVHIDEAKRSDVKPVIVHGELTVLAEEYMTKHPTKPDGSALSFSEALKHVAKLEQASITSKGGNA